MRRLAWIAAALGACTCTLLFAAGCSDGGSSGSTGTTDTTAPADTAGGDDTAAGDDVLPVDTTAPADTVAPVQDDVRVVTLLDGVELDLVNGKSIDIPVEIPANTISVTVSALGTADGTYVVNKWVQSDGSVLVTPNWLTQGSEQDQGGICMSCADRATMSEGAIALIAPNNPSVTLVPGEHTVSIFGIKQKPVAGQSGGTCGDGTCTFIDQFQCPQDCAPSPLNGKVLLSVFAKVSPDGVVPDTGVLDLNLHFTGARGWTAATAPTDADFQAVLDSLRTIYAQVGLTIGEITYRDIDARFQVIESVTGPNSDLMELYSQSEGNALNALDLYFVDELSSQFGIILGVAGGIPGPPLVQGSQRSGVAIVVKQIQGVPAGVDTTMAHEMGHFLGLFHTSEQAFFPPQIHDPLPDTPENDESYLMFNTGAGNVLSPYQGRVMRSNPWVRHPADTTLGEDGL
ncbi:MAG: hypothetical protein KC635_02735 [Myxococcales bacterium]|nr:hypothetical protein [Myxococcales bacterium]MCB9736339.1 hypothetical protein [Deltaproteobacteria bacterium]